MCVCIASARSCFKCWKIPQLFLLKSHTGLWVIRNLSGDLCTSNDLIHFECLDKSLEIASCTVAEEWPESEPSSSSRPAQASASAPAAPKRKLRIGYDMEEVKKYCSDAEAHCLLTRPDEECDLKVIYEVFGRQCYCPANAAAAALFSAKNSDRVFDLGGHIGTAAARYLAQGISGADSYEPTGTYDCPRASYVWRKAGASCSFLLALGLGPCA